ncbi:ImmA/IrrE family metallo-endopeptidase [Kineosporia sp. J2-2]|uniref:ImmA/IrrE family metallo-endopeptidase n=1 Tax=Kineosporia corallincola TaxID=2835133 RepID=A0ABS5TME4_9ACTN|nr:ImmA/IrrE family metallo-endopeptidase [Kineosporia corallincola]MBT0772280.1 ImmA/IrrE family metallo-endopeptidase [Kineosporia corallincola]
MRERQLRRRCRALLRELDVPQPFGSRELCRCLSAHRGRPIRLVPFPIESPGPFGIWFSTDAADVIIYQSQTTPAHQEHIILHEVGHIIAGHDGEQLAAGEAVRVHRRSAYDNRQEREAELIATILHEWAGRSDGLGSRAAADPGLAGHAAVLDRIGQALSGGGGRG